MKIYHTETQEDYDALMVELEKQGAKWFLATKPTEWNNWPEFEHQTGIKVQDGILDYHGVEYFERANPETPIIKYTAKKETQPPEWTNWLARDEDGDLWAFENKPFKRIGLGAWVESECGSERVEETDDTFSHIKWTDEQPTSVRALIKEFSDKVESLRELGEIYNLIQWDDKGPTEVIWGTGLGMSTLDKYKSIMNAKAHGYDEVPTMEKSKVYHGKTTPENANENDILFEKGTIDGKQVTIMSRHNGTTFEPIGITDNPTTMDNSEVETDTNKDMVNKPNHYIGEYGLEVEDVLRNFIPRYTDPYVGHRVASAIEYLLRSPLKNQRQDIEKAGKNIQQALAYLDMMDEEK